MKVTIEIPENFEVDYLIDQFDDFFNRIRVDINEHHVMCGRYEMETIEMMKDAFKRSSRA